MPLFLKNVTEFPDILSYSLKASLNLKIPFPFRFGNRIIRLTLHPHGYAPRPSDKESHNGSDLLCSSSFYPWQVSIEKLLGQGVSSLECHLNSHVTTVWLWANHWTSYNFSFLECLMKILCSFAHSRSIYWGPTKARHSLGGWRLLWKPDPVSSLERFMV